MEQDEWKQSHKWLGCLVEDGSCFYADKETVGKGPCCTYVNGPQLDKNDHCTRAKYTEEKKG